MPLDLEAASLVRQKVYSTLNAVDNETENGRIWWNAARELFNKLAQAGTDRLQFVPFSAADAVTSPAGIDHGIDAAHQIYMVYAKKRNTATDAYLKVVDDADADSGSTADEKIILALLDGNDEVGVIYPTGLAMANGLVTNSTTTVNGETENAAADAPDGFYVIGS